MFEAWDLFLHKADFFISAIFWIAVMSSIAGILFMLILAERDR